MAVAFTVVAVQMKTCNVRAQGMANCLEVPACAMNVSHINQRETLR